LFGALVDRRLGPSGPWAPRGPASRRPRPPAVPHGGSPLPEDQRVGHECGRLLEIERGTPAQHVK